MPGPHAIKALLLLPVWCATPDGLVVQDEYVLTRIDRTIDLDGQITDKEWSDIPSLAVTV